MDEFLKTLLDAGKITKEEYDAAISKIPDTGAAWEAREAAHEKEVAKLKKTIADNAVREAAKDKIIASFSTAGNPAAKPDADPIFEVVEYMKKKRGITK